MPPASTSLSLAMKVLWASICLAWAPTSPSAAFTLAIDAAIWVRIMAALVMVCSVAVEAMVMSEPPSDRSWLDRVMKLVASALARNWIPLGSDPSRMLAPSN